MALGAALSRWARKPVTWIVVAAAVLGAAFGTMKVIERRDRIRWAREEAVPEIRRLHPARGAPARDAIVFAEAKH